MKIQPYSLLMLGGIGISIWYWARLARRDERLVWIYVGALIGAFLGAKVFYLLAEGWMDFGLADCWQRLATGKTITGGLLGGYAGVELAKRLVYYPGVTGDWFALIAPAGIIVGRFGCLAHGCCYGLECSPHWFTMHDAAGVTRWPAVPFEIAFNVAALLGFAWLRRNHQLTGQHFHLYLIGYGGFRFFHEFLRAEPRILGPFTGYHLAALAVFGFGLVGFIGRWRELHKLAVRA